MTPASEAPFVREENIGIWGVLIVLGQHKISLTFVPIFLSTSMYFYVNSLPPIYTGTSKILPPQYNQYNVNTMNNKFGGSSNLGNTSVGIKNPSDLYIGILNSQSVVDAVIDENRLHHVYHTKVRDDVRKKLQANTAISAGKDGIITIIVEDESSQLAAKLANSYIDQLYFFSRELSRTETSRKLGFYDGILKKAKEKLAQADLNVITIESNPDFAESIKKEWRSQKQEMEVSVDLKEDLVNLNTEFTAIMNLSAGGDQGAAIAREKIDALEKRIGGIKNSKQYSQYLSLKYNQAIRDVKYWESIIQMIGKYNEINKEDETRDLSLIQTLDRAYPSFYKAKPNTKLSTILTLIVSIIFTVIAIITKDWFVFLRKNNQHINDKIQMVISAWKPKKKPKPVRVVRRVRPKLPTDVSASQSTSRSENRPDRMDKVRRSQSDVGSSSSLSSPSVLKHQQPHQ